MAFFKFSETSSQIWKPPHFESPQYGKEGDIIFQLAVRVLPSKYL